MLSRLFVLSLALAIVFAAGAIVRATSPPMAAPVAAKLFDSTDYVPIESETAQINENEAAILRTSRARPQHKSVQVTRINRAALAQSVITLQTTDGVQRQYVQEKQDFQPSPLNMKHWYGTSQSGLLTIVFTDDGQFAGKLTDYGKYFRFDTLPGTTGLVVMTEIDTNFPIREKLIHPERKK